MGLAGRTAKEQLSGSIISDPPLNSSDTSSFWNPPGTDGVGAPIPHSEEISQPRTGIEDGRAIGRMYEDRHAKAELRWF